MKRPLISLLIVSLFCLSGALGCGQASGDAVAAGATDDMAMLGLLPVHATGVFFINLQKAMSIPATQDALTKSNEKLDEFIAETGIDPSKDIFSLAGAVTNQSGGDETEGVMVVNVKFKKDVLIKKIKESKGEVSQETYEGVTVFVSNSGPPANKETHIAFLDESTVAVGTPADVRSVIDVHQKRADSLLKNAKLMKSVESSNRKAIFWAAFQFTKDDIQSMTAGNPMLGQLGGMQSMIMSVDYQDKNILGEIECRSGSAEENQQMVDMLNGLKSFAAMGAAENPQAAEMLRGIEITSGSDNVRISAKIPEALLQGMEKEGY